ncbi:MAG TPA: protein phosphatase 2C domain-containing protein, partial [Planctomycetaceae bacterium]
LFVVADGMGGHAVGELASRIATESLPLTYLKSRHANPADALREAILFANVAIHGKGQANRDFARMGTTCTALVLSERGAVIGHVGDSRCYRIRRGRIDQLTFDHSLQWELIRRGGMNPEDVFLQEPRNVITRSLGPEPEVEVDVEGPFAVLPGDVYVLCSDGLPNHVADHEIGTIAAHLPAAEATRMLVHLANARGGTDNVTAVVVQVGPLPAELAGYEPPDPTKPPSPWLLVLAWTIAAIFLVGLILLFTGRYVEGVVTAGLSITALAATLFRLWQLWYRRPRERPLHGDETVHWRPYRTASAALTEDFLKTLVRIEADLHRAAEEEHWPVKASRHEPYCKAAREALAAGRHTEALEAVSKAIDALMRGLTRHRRPDNDPLPDLVSEPRE